MRSTWATIAVFLLGLTGAALISSAQTDPPTPVPGGATGTNVACVQIGDLNSGTFIGTFVQGTGEGWEERGHMKPGVFNFKERQRSETSLELADASRGLAVQFDFERKRVRTTAINQPDAWRDIYHMLNATDKEQSADCSALARLAGGTAAAGTGAGTGGSQSAPRRSGNTTVQFITIKIGTFVSIPPGTKLTATSGPPCPSQPGFFLCPNKFTCAPIGGVCCPGAGACGGGTFCDKFIANSCIGPGDPAFCAGTGNPVTGVSLHCAPGSVCQPGNFCTP